MTSALNIGVPVTPQMRMVDPATGIPEKPWYSFFVALWLRGGGSQASLSPLLDLLSDTIGATIYRAASGWTGLNPGAEYQVERMGATVPEWDWLDGNSFQAQAKNAFFVGPTTGANSIPTFRDIATADLVPVAGAIPGVQAATGATAGDVGEYLTANVPIGSAVTLTTATAADAVTLVLTEGDWDVRGLIAYTGGGAVTGANAWLSETSATDPGAPNGGAYFSQDGGIAATSVGTMRLGVPIGGATVYLSTIADFAGSLSAYGFVGARRMR